MRRSFFNKVGKTQSPHYLQFNADNVDIVGGQDYKPSLSDFAGEFYVDVDFEYSALHTSWAPIIGALGNLNGFRLMLNNSTILVSMGSNGNLTSSLSTSYNTKYNVRISRDASDNVYYSLNGGSDVLMGVKSGLASVRTLATDQFGFGVPERKLTGKIYRFNVNGIEFPMNEGSGSVIKASDGTELTISTQNAGGLIYINDTMWQPYTP